jgi:hypothetical protein
MRLRKPLPLAVLAGIFGLGAISVAAAQDAPKLAPAANPELRYTVTLNGENEVDGSGTPNQGDLTGDAVASITINPNTGQVCVNITTTDIDPMTAMHIHTGAAGTNGSIFIDFTPVTGTAVAKCVTDTPTKAQAVVANPAGHYLNVHNGAFPSGAIRGQLVLNASAAAGQLNLLDEPVRAYDSRSTTDGKLVADTARVVDLSSGLNGSNGSVPAVPAGARAALITLTVTQTNGSGFLKAYSSALTTPPATSTINWTAPNSDIATSTTVAVDGSGKIALLAGLNGTHVIVDVAGYYL